MAKLFVACGLAGAALISVPAPVTAQSTQTDETQYDRFKKCMPDKVMANWTKAVPAEELAFRIAQECSELLPQRSVEDCGEAQARCDAIQQETNASMRAGTEQFAYRMIIQLRQGAN